MSIDHKGHYRCNCRYFLRKNLTFRSLMYKKLQLLTINCNFWQRKKRECSRVTAISNFKKSKELLRNIYKLYSKSSCGHAIRYTPSTPGPWCPRTAADVCRRVAECNQLAADCRAKPRSRPITAMASIPEAEGSCRGVVPTSTYLESITRASRRRRDIPFLDLA